MAHEEKRCRVAEDDVSLSLREKLECTYQPLACRRCSVSKSRVCELRDKIQGDGGRCRRLVLFLKYPFVFFLQTLKISLIFVQCEVLIYVL